MKILIACIKSDLTMLRRNPGYIIPTMLMPSLMFLMFGLSHASDGNAATLLAGSFATFAVFGVVFFQFGIAVAKDREFAWATYLRTLPAGPQFMFAARCFSALVMSLCSATLVLLTAIVSVHLHITTSEALRIYCGLILGAIPFSLFGIAVGYWVSPKGALPVVNLLYFLLAFGGGLWTPFDNLPDAVQVVAVYLPSYHWGELVHEAVLGGQLAIVHVGWLAGYAALFACLAVSGLRRDEGLRYS